MALVDEKRPGGLRGLLRPPRRRRVLACPSDRRRPHRGRGRHPGGLPLDLALEARATTRRAEACARGPSASSATGRSTRFGAAASPTRQARPRRRGGARGASRRRAHRLRGDPPRHGRAGARRARQMLPHEQLAGDRARLLRRLQPLRDRGDAECSAWHHQGPDASRTGEARARFSPTASASTRQSRALP